MKTYNTRSIGAGGGGGGGGGGSICLGLMYVSLWSKQGEMIELTV